MRLVLVVIVLACAGCTPRAPQSCPEATAVLHELLMAAPSACTVDSECMRSPVQGQACAPFIISQRGWPEYDARHGAAMRAARAVIDAECGWTKPCAEIALALKCVDKRCVNAP